MKHRSFISLFFILVAGFIAITGGSGCANIIPPEGGPRDTIPPVLLDAKPGDSTRNFKGNRLTFEFDEFVDVQNVQEQLIVSPTPQSNPEVNYKLKTVTVRIKDTLEPNTTYSFDFGNAIKDYTEGNPVKNFTYIFSTGPYIDSLELSGNVLFAENGRVDTTLIVMLHTNGDDSAVVNEKPRYYTRLDSKGGFHFRNLPPKTFYLYALKDESGTKRYFSDKQAFAFADSSINVDGQNKPVTLYAYTGTKGSAQTNIPTLPGINPRGRRNNDNTQEKRLRYQANLINGQQDLLSKLIISFDEPLRSFDTSKIRLYTDSAYHPVTAYSFREDSTHKKITLIHTWKEKTLYHIIMEKDFAEDSVGRKLLKTDTLSFSTRKLSEYGSLKLKLRGIDLSKNPVLQFVVGDDIAKSIPMSSDNISEPLFLPGEYQLRLLYDNNKNGVWDPGQFFGKHLQPEIVKPIERKINVKAAWQNEVEIVL